MDHIVGYDFCAASYCPNCIISALPTGKDQKFDGWALGAGIQMTAEENLSEIAYAFGINRMNEHSFDQSDFPKVIFSWQLDTDEVCTTCHGAID